MTTNKHRLCACNRRLVNRVLLLLMLVVLAGCASGPPAKPENLCSVFEQKYGWHRAALKMQKKWDTPLSVPMAIMAQESSFRAKAKPPRRKILGFIPGKRPSSAYGYSQALRGTWKAYVEDTGDYWRKRDDFVDALDFVNWYVNRAARVNGIKRTDSYSLYLNYHEGLEGYKRKTYLKKKWLLGVASKVQKRQQRYAAQYRKCKSSLPKSRFWGS